MKNLRSYISWFTVRLANFFLKEVEIVILGIREKMLERRVKFLQKRLGEIHASMEILSSRIKEAKKREKSEE